MKVKQCDCGNTHSYVWHCHGCFDYAQRQLRSEAKRVDATIAKSACARCGHAQHKNWCQENVTTSREGVVGSCACGCAPDGGPILPESVVDTLLTALGWDMYSNSCRPPGPYYAGPSWRPERQLRGIVQRWFATLRVDAGGLNTEVEQAGDRRRAKLENEELAEERKGRALLAEATNRINDLETEVARLREQLTKAYAWWGKHGESCNVKTREELASAQAQINAAQDDRDHARREAKSLEEEVARLTACGRCEQHDQPRVFCPVCFAAAAEKAQQRPGCSGCLAREERIRALYAKTANDIEWTLAERDEAREKLHELREKLEARVKDWRKAFEEWKDDDSVMAPKCEELKDRIDDLLADLFEEEVPQEVGQA